MIVPVSVFVGLAILVGLIGIAVPVLPGVLLVWAGIVVWALVARDAVGWWVLGVATALMAAGWVLQYVLPGRRLSAAGVPSRTTLVGLAAGVVGFFVVPVLGLPLFFVVGVYLAELARVGAAAAWPSTRVAVSAALYSYGLEMLTGLALALTWAFGVWRLLF